MENIGKAGRQTHTVSFKWFKTKKIVNGVGWKCGEGEWGGNFTQFIGFYRRVCLTMRLVLMKRKKTVYEFRHACIRFVWTSCHFYWGRSSLYWLVQMINSIWFIYLKLVLILEIESSISLRMKKKNFVRDTSFI